MLDQLLDPFTQCLDADSAQRVIELGIPPPVERRVNELAARANDGLLSDDERAEYEALLNATDFIAILKLKTKRRLAAEA